MLTHIAILIPLQLVNKLGFLLLWKTKHYKGNQNPAEITHRVHYYDPRDSQYR